MRIVHINLERSWRGGERQVLYLMEGLRRLGHECHLVARSNEAFVSRVRSQGFPVTVIRKPYLLSGAQLSGFDVVHAHETRGLQLAAVWKTVNRLPLVFTRRVDNPPSGNVLTRAVYARIDCLAAISGNIGAVMNAWGFDPGRVRVIPSAVESSPSPREDTVARLRERFRGRKVAGCVASLEKRKDHRTLLRAASLVQNVRQDVVFVLIGDGALGGELEDAARESGLRNVVFEGFQDDPSSYYPVFDLFVMTSRQEGLGSSILDAFASGVPVVATAAGGIPEIVINEETGLLADIGDAGMVADAILRMLSDDGLRTRCTGKARALLTDRFTIDRMAGAYEQVYQEVLRRG